MSAKLGISLTSKAWNPGTQHAAVAEVVPRGGTERTASSPQTTFSLKVNQSHEVPLEPGDYTVRVYLPSGDILTESVSMTSDQSVEFELPESPYEWLGQEQLLGSIQRLPTRARVKAIAESLTREAPRRATPAGPAAATSAPTSKAIFAEDTIVKARQRASYAMRDAERACDSIERNSGASRVAEIHAERLVTEVDHDRAFPDMELPFDALIDWWAGAPKPDGKTLQLAHHDDHNAKWICPQSPAQYLHGRPRAFASMLDPTKRRHVAVLPEGWVCSSEAAFGRPTEASLLMTVVIGAILQTGDEQIEAARWSCSASVDDVEFMTYLGFLYSGQSSAANAALKTQGADLLFEKGMNPVAAAAGAYGLLSFSAPERSDGRLAWRSWVRNLFTRFPDLPDGAIALARLYLRNGEDEGSEKEEIDVEKLRRYLLEAVRRGIPYFTLGITLLTEMLSLVKGDDEATQRTGEAVDLTRRAHRLVSQLGRVAVPGKLFTVLSVRQTPP